MSESIGERAELIVGLEEVRAGIQDLPLQYVNLLGGHVRLDVYEETLGQLIGMDADVEVFEDIPQAIATPTLDLQKLFASLTAGTTSEIAQRAQLHLQVITDHLADMQTHGEAATQEAKLMLVALQVASRHAAYTRAHVTAEQQEAEAAQRTRQLLLGELDDYIGGL
jgi:hypothetical protein